MNIGTETPGNLLQTCSKCKKLNYVGCIYKSLPGYDYLCPECFEQIQPNTVGNPIYAWYADDLNFFDSKGVKNE